jgi:hypothetical protein
LLGHWKNFDELESNLSLEELTALLEVQRKQVNEHRKFLAAIQGIDLDAETKETPDITTNIGYHATEEGFGVGEGLAFMQLGGE